MITLFIAQKYITNTNLYLHTIMGDNRDSKRKRESHPTAEDFMLIGKEVQNKSGRKIGAIMTEDRAFRDFFGTNVVVTMVLWKMLNETGLLPDEGRIIHLLWTMYFFKVYPKQGQGCSAAGGSSGAIDPKTFRKYIWPFIYAISDLESLVVSYYCPGLSRAQN